MVNSAIRMQSGCPTHCRCHLPVHVRRRHLPSRHHSKKSSTYQNLPTRIQFQRQAVHCPDPLVLRAIRTLVVRSLPVHRRQILSCRIRATSPDWPGRYGDCHSTWRPDGMTSRCGRWTGCWWTDGSSCRDTRHCREGHDLWDTKSTTSYQSDNNRGLVICVETYVGIDIHRRRRNTQTLYIEFTCFFVVIVNVF